MVLSLTAYTLTSALGAGLKSTWTALAEQRSGIEKKPWETVDLDTCVAEVAGLDDVRLPTALSAYDCRNNRLALLAMEQDGFADAVRRAVSQYGARRIGVFLGTSTSGILSSEVAYRHIDPGTGRLPDWLDYRRTHNSYSVADFSRRYLGLTGPAFVVSTACSSSVKVFGVAQRMMDAGWIDAAVVGGVDSLCLTTLYGFNSLQLLGSGPCTPFGMGRTGITIGEAGGYALLERCAPAIDQQTIYLRGVGESSDAHHMSSPHPEGRGARQAMRNALGMAGLAARDIDYVVLHGTGTPSNDAVEDLAVVSTFDHAVPCSSIKGHTGHTLGAAGVVNVVVAALAIKKQTAPAGVGTFELDPSLRSNYLLRNEERLIRHVLANAFGFGGSNASLVISRGVT